MLSVLHNRRRLAKLKTILIIAALVFLPVSLPPLDAQSLLPSPADERIGVTDTEVVVGSCAPLSGQMKERGSQVVAGGRAYFNYVNEHGGVNGRKIKLISCDDHYDAEGSISCFNTCLNGKVFLGTLFQGTVPASKYVPMSETYHLPIVGISAGPDFISTPFHPYVFQLRESFRSENQVQIQKLWKDLGIRRIAVAYQNDAYGAIVRESVVQALSDLKSAPVAQISFSRLENNMDSVIHDLQAAKPQAVILGCAGVALPTLVKRRSEIGPQVQMVGLSPATDLVIAGAGKAADDMLISQVVPLTRRDLPTVKLYEKIMEQDHEPPNFSSFEGFLIGMVVVEGIKRCGKDLTRSNFVKMTEEIRNFDLGLGPQYRISFATNNHIGLHGGVYWTAIKDGKVTTVADWKPFMRH